MTKRQNIWEYQVYKYLKKSRTVLFIVLSDKKYDRKLIWWY